MSLLVLCRFFRDNAWIVYPAAKNFLIRLFPKSPLAPDSCTSLLIFLSQKTFLNHGHVFYDIDK
jgi:hypothetical protein